MSYFEQVNIFLLFHENLFAKYDSNTKLTVEMLIFCIVIIVYVFNFHFFDDGFRGLYLCYMLK